MPSFPSLPSPPTLFPTYLLPSLPFRSRNSSTDSNASSTSTTSTTSSEPKDTFLDGSTSHLRCARCASDLALSTQIISKGFTGRHGRAYLVAPPPTPQTSSRVSRDGLPDLPNTYTHKPVPRQLVTGAHTVGDISCAQCGSVLGWKYVSAEEEGQRYKVGKFILETRRVCRVAGWEGEFGGEEGVRRGSLGEGSGKGMGVGEEVEFDSQDEEECEELFLGVWSKERAGRRRRERRFEEEV